MNTKLTPKPFENVAVVGMHFREKDGIPAKAYVESFVPPVNLLLEREPENAYDSFAIKVIFNNQHIGYIEASQAMYIAPWMDDGWQFTCTVVDLEARRNNLHPICRVEPINSDLEESETSGATTAD